MSGKLPILLTHEVPLPSQLEEYFDEWLNAAKIADDKKPGARRMDQSWVLSVLNQCREQSVPFFFKQWGGTQKAKTGRLLNGRTYDELPLSSASFNQVSM